MKNSLLLPVLVAVILSVAFAASAENPPAKGTVYFLVHSGACPCQREACAMAGPLAAQVQTRLSKGYEYVSYDYGTRPEAVDPLLRAHKLFVFPVILVLDEKKSEVFQAQGKLDRPTVLKKLRELGVITRDD